MDFTTFGGAVTWIGAHGYLLLFLALLIEGPVVTAAASFLAALGQLNIVAVFFLAILGDLGADILYYAIGYFTRLFLVERFGYLAGMTKERVKIIQDHLERHAGKTILAIKLAPLIPGPGLAVVGASHYSPKKFAAISALITLPKVIFFMIVGYYFGSLYDRLERYLNYGGYLIVLAIIAIFTLRYLYGKLAKKISKNIEI